MFWGVEKSCVWVVPHRILRSLKTSMLTHTGGAILRPSIGEWVLGVALEATIIVVSFPRAKALSFELEHNSIQSVGTVEARCSPAYYATRLATLDTCGVRVYRLR